MIHVLSIMLSGLGRRFAFWGAIAAAVGFAAWALIRRGRRAAEADLAIRRAEARIRAMQTSRDTRHDVQSSDQADLKRRADRWMRD
jgi:hypothetical protein